MERLTDNKDYCTTWSECEMPEGKCVFLEKCYDRKIYNRLREYEDAEEQGLLFRLPFAVGDIVYWVADAIYPFEVKYIRIDAFGFNVRFAYRGTDENRRYWEIDNSISVVGEKVFLTKEEAEAALERISENA